MLLARAGDGSRIPAQPDVIGACPRCDKNLLPKCGRSFDGVIGHLADAYPEQRRRIFADADEIRAVAFPHREPDTDKGGK